MNRTKRLSFLIVMLIALSSCSGSQEKKIKAVGDQTMGILKNIGFLSEKDFRSKLLSVDELHKLVSNKELVPNSIIHNYYALMLKDDWNNRIAADYNKLRSKGRSLGIVWEQIRYTNFRYEITDDEGIKSAECSVYFRYAHQTYKVYILTLWDGSNYRLMRINDLAVK